MADTNHVSDAQLGGPRRARALRVLVEFSLPESWEMSSDVPKTRGDCPTQRPCPHVKCRYHLWLVEGEAMPGRRRARAAPASAFHPWTNTTCALDVAESNANAHEQYSVEDVARMLGMSARQVRRIVRQAKAKLAANPDAEAVSKRMEER